MIHPLEAEWKRRETPQPLNVGDGKTLEQATDEFVSGCDPTAVGIIYWIRRSGDIPVYCGLSVRETHQQFLRLCEEYDEMFMCSAKPMRDEGRRALEMRLDPLPDLTDPEPNDVKPEDAIAFVRYAQDVLWRGKID